MAPHSHILAWKMRWTRSLMGYSTWGHKELDTAEKLGSSSRSTDLKVNFWLQFHGVGNATFHLAVSLESKAALSWASVPGNPPPHSIWSVPIVPGRKPSWMESSQDVFPFHHSTFEVVETDPQMASWISIDTSAQKSGTCHRIPQIAPGPIGLCERLSWNVEYNLKHLLLIFSWGWRLWWEVSKKTLIKNMSVLFLPHISQGSFSHLNHTNANTFYIRSWKFYISFLFFCADCWEQMMNIPVFSLEGQGHHRKIKPYVLFSDSLKF